VARLDGHIHNSLVQGSVIFAWVLLFGFVYHQGRARLVRSDGEKRQALGKALANFY
jgi:hypothetical protein